MRKGFTLIELLVVISIIGVLVAFSLVSFTGSQRQARDTQRKSDLKQYQNSLEQFANRNNGLYPYRTNFPLGDSNSLCVTDLGLTDCPVDPKDPVSVYRYWSNGSGVAGSATGTEYVLWTALEGFTPTQYWVACSAGRTGKTTTQPSASSCPANLNP